jgi:dsRNA-specific ribonuclease
MSLPPLPPISSNAALAIFIHRSFRSSGFSSDSFGDGDRLAFLGKRVLGMVVADVQFKRRPMLDFIELEVSTTAA